MEEIADVLGHSVRIHGLEVAAELIVAGVCKCHSDLAVLIGLDAGALAVLHDLRACDRLRILLRRIMAVCAEGCGEAGRQLLKYVEACICRFRNELVARGVHCDRVAADRIAVLHFVAVRRCCGARFILCGIVQAKLAVLIADRCNEAAALAPDLAVCHACAAAARIVDIVCSGDNFIRGQLAVAVVIENGDRTVVQNGFRTDLDRDIHICGDASCTSGSEDRGCLHHHSSSCCKNHCLFHGNSPYHHQ